MRVVKIYRRGLAEPPNLMPPRNTCLPLNTKYSRENTKLRSSAEHTLGEMEAGVHGPARMRAQEPEGVRASGRGGTEVPTCTQTHVKCSKRRWHPDTGLCPDIRTLATPNFKIDLGIGIGPVCLNLLAGLSARIYSIFLSTK